MIRILLAPLTAAVLTLTACSSPAGPPADGPVVALHPLTPPRADHTATRLPDGRVLLVGGWPAEGAAPLASTEIYDGGAFRPAASLRTGRGGHTATRLRDGWVLIVGGVGARGTPTDAVELFDPATGQIRDAARLPAPRAIHAAVLLPDGHVLVVGGITDRPESGPMDSALLYYPETGTWHDAGRMSVPRYKLALAAIPDGALVIGGQTRDDPAAALAGTEIYDVRTGTFRRGPSMSTPRYKISEAVATLPDGRVVITGGETVDVYHQGEITALPGAPTGPHLFPAAAALNDGTVLLTGGYDQHVHILADTRLIRP